MFGTIDLPLLVTAVLCTVVAYCVYLFGNRNANYWSKRGIPSTRIYTTPIVGAWKDQLLQRRGFGMVIKDIYFELEGKRFGGYIQLTRPILMVRDPELINQVLIKDFIHFEDRGPTMIRKSDLFSMGLSNMSGDEWRNARHKLTPTFTSGKLKLMFEPIIKCSENVVTHLKDKIGQDINAKDLSLRHIINVIASVAFGLDIDTLKDDKDSDFYKFSAGFFKPSMGFILKFVMATNFPKIRNYYNFKLMDNDVEQFFRKLTKDIIKYRETTGTRRNDFLQLMLDQRDKERESARNGHVTTENFEAYDPDDKELLEQLKNTPYSSSHSKHQTDIFTDEFIASQTFLFISGGSETTSTVLSFVLYELAVNEQCQKRLQQEIDDTLSTHEFNYQAIKKMTYMEQFISETLRCHPIAGVLLRLCTKDYKIPDSDVVIEKGVSVLIPVLGLHNDPQYFPDPEVFNPDRFEDMDSIQKGTYFSFGEGPRICIAMRLAMLEMKMVLAKILSSYDVLISQKTKQPIKLLVNSILPNVDGGIWVKFRAREV